jgi:hypothetical protein
LTARDVHLAVVGDRLRVEAPAGILTAADRLALAEHKAGLLALLGAAWDQAAADALLAEVQARRRELFGEEGWPDDAAACGRLAERADAIDAAWLARDLAGLRRAAAEYLSLVSPPGDAAAVSAVPAPAGNRMGGSEP